jgi:outer membrane immunogenic protein
MTRGLTLAFLGSILSLLAAPASAQGYNYFAGPYVGAAVGFGSHHVDTVNQNGVVVEDTNTSATVGGYAGYNWLLSCFLLGLETDINWLGKSPTGYEVEIGPTGLNETSALNSKIDWFGTLRGRAGYLVQDNWLLYATGGIAYARVNHTFSDNCVACGNSIFNLGPFSQSNSATKTGGTVGGGTEFLFAPNWIFRAEALYVDLPSATHTYVVVGPPGTAIANIRWDDDFWVGRVGITYAFGGP